MQDRRDTTRLFRGRLHQVMEERGFSQSALARRAGIDRSTLSQLLSQDTDRLPRADTIAAIAMTLQVSLDWLLGLSQEETVGTDILGQSMEIAAADFRTATAWLNRWHEDASGYKIRYVPTTLPDLLKTDAVIEYEFTPTQRREANDAREEAADRLDYSRHPETDMEVCNTVDAVEGFALGEGVWRGLSRTHRIEQLERMIQLAGELYPTFRWFLYDARTIWSVPMTIFGPKRAAVYMGDMYFVFNTTEHIRVLTRHFDDLIRAARVQPTDIPSFLSELLDKVRQT